MERDRVVRGLAENPAVPVDVLVRLMRDRPEPVARGFRERADLPPLLQREMAVHPFYLVRAVLAGHRTTDQAVRVALLDDPDWRVRTWAFGQRPPSPLPDEILNRVMTELCNPTEDVPFVPHELFDELFSTDGSRIRLAARHPDPRVRRFAATAAWLSDLRFLAADPDPEVAAAAAGSIAERERIMQPADLPEHHCHAFWDVLHRPLSPDLARQIAASTDLAAVRAAAPNLTMPAGLLDRHPDTEVRALIASRPDLAPEQVQRLTGDPDAPVRRSVATRAGLTPSQVAALADDPDGSVRKAVTLYAYVCDEDREILAGNADLPAEEVSRWARSENPRLRREAARHRDLPSGLITRLTADPDPRVRMNLALTQPGIPAELLLRCYLDDPRRTELISRPRFPRQGLAHLATHAEPAVRLLALRDPKIDPAVVEHLTTDPVAWVRARAARCPRLPVERIVALLDDPELAVAAAANPALPWKAVFEDV